MSARDRKPAKFRGRELEEVRELDPDGKIVVHHRLVDSFARLLKLMSASSMLGGASTRRWRR